MVDASPSSRSIRPKGSFFNRFRKRGSGEDASEAAGSSTVKSMGKETLGKSKETGKSGSSSTRRSMSKQSAVVAPAEHRQHSSRNTSPESLEPRRERYVVDPVAVPTKKRESRTVDHHGAKTPTSHNTHKSTKSPSRSNLRKGNRDPNELSIPPPARKAAFSGPPRFDWIDIETAAATKIQSIFRKNKAMNDMEARGMSTSAIRNRRRRRRAAEKNRSGGYFSISEDAPSIFSCCAIGLVFGDATEDDDEETFRKFQKKQYEERLKQQAAHEEAIRKRFLRNKVTGGGSPTKVVETVEVVEE